jgi:hypothetical protein
MPRGARTPLPEAATALAYGEAGYGAKRISQIIGLPENTIDDIIHSRNGWDQIMNTEEFKRYRDRSRRVIEAGLTEFALKSIRRAEDTINKASCGQAVMALGVSVDKIRALAGESGIELHLHKDVHANMDDLLDILRETLEVRAREIDVTPPTGSEKP